MHGWKHIYSIARTFPFAWQEEFFNQLEIIISKKKSQTIWVDEEWMTEKEMKDAKWTAPLG